MEIEFDPDKDAINRRKHGLSLADAALIDLDRAAIVEDRRFDYGERRFLAYAPIRGQASCPVVYNARLGFPCHRLEKG